MAGQDAWSKGGGDGMDETRQRTVRCEDRPEKHEEMDAERREKEGVRVTQKAFSLVRLQWRRFALYLHV